MNIIKWLLVGAVLLLNAACTYSSLGVSGRVIDKDTKQPIENAIVIATWQGAVSQWVQTSNSCYHMEIVLTDKDGKYKIKPWIISTNSIVSGKNRYMAVYSEGYNAYYGFDDNNFEVEKFKGSKKEYFDLLDGVSGGGVSYCEGDKYSAQKVYKLLCRVKGEMSKVYDGSVGEKEKMDYIDFLMGVSVVNENKETHDDINGVIRNRNSSDNYSHEELMKW